MADRLEKIDTDLQDESLLNRPNEETLRGQIESPVESRAGGSENSGRLEMSDLSRTYDK